MTVVSTAAMTAALTPGAALARIATLTPGLRAAAVLDADGAVLAGDAEVAARAQEALRGAGSAPEVHTPDGLHVVRAGDRAIAAQAGPEVLGGLLLADVRDALARLLAR
jgi:hypothetical protein